jgi:hypothetical protein
MTGGGLVCISSLFMTSSPSGDVLSLSTREQQQSASATGERTALADSREMRHRPFKSSFRAWGAYTCHTQSRRPLVTLHRQRLNRRVRQCLDSVCLSVCLSVLRPTAIKCIDSVFLYVCLSVCLSLPPTTHGK